MRQQHYSFHMWRLVETAVVFRPLSRHMVAGSDHGGCCSRRRRVSSRGVDSGHRGATNLCPVAVVVPEENMHTVRHYCAHPQADWLQIPTNLKHVLKPGEDVRQLKPHAALLIIQGSAKGM